MNVECLTAARHALRLGARAARSLSLFAALAVGGVSVAAPPIEYTTLYSGSTCSNSGCHGSPPRLSSMIVPKGATAADGAGLRSIMAAALGNPMGTILGSPALTDDVLNTIRLYLVDVRDGGLAAAAGSSTDFGSSAKDVSGSVREFTITNERGVNATFAFAPINGNSEFFVVAGGTCSSSTTLLPGGTCTVQMQFKPTATGGRTGSLRYTFNSPAGITAQQRSIGLTGTGLAPPPVFSISPATSPGAPFAFSSNLGVASATNTWTLTNSGGAGSTSLTLGTLTVPTGYTRTGTCGPGFVLSVVNGVPNNCTLTLSFTPSTVNTVDAQLSVAHTAAGSPALIYLRGTGIGAPQLQLGAVTPAFPVTLVGHPVSGTVTATNSGTAAASLGNASIAPAGAFTPSTGCNAVLLASGGGNCSVSVTFNPGAAGDNQAATLTVPFAVGLMAERALSASARQLVTTPAVPPTLQAPLGVAVTTTLQVSNPSGVGTFLAPISLSGATNFSITSNTCATTLAAASSCSVVVTFTSDTNSAVSTTLNVRYGPSTAQNASQGIAVTINGSTQLIPLIEVAPSALAFPATLPGATSTLSVDIGNTGNAALNLTSIALADNAPADFSITSNSCGASVAVGAAPCRVTVAFAPSTQSPRAARLVVTHNAAGGSTNIPLSGTTLLRPLASLSPTRLDFASQVRSTGSAPLSTVLTNTGNRNLNLGTISISGASAADFAQLGSTCAVGAVVAPLASCQLTLRFTPSALGTRDATLQIAHDASGSPSSVALSGIGVAAPAADIQTNQSGLAFASTVMQSSSPAQAVTVRNSGTADLQFSAIVATGAAASDFAIRGTCAAGTPLPPNATCTIDVVFTPLAVGARAAQLSIESNASRGTLTLALSGTGLVQTVPVLRLTPPSTLPFDAQTVGGLYPARPIQLQNVGGAPMHLAGIVVSGPGFTARNNCAATLAVDETCEISVAFAAAEAGASYTGQVAISSDASALPQVVQLSGRGTAVTPPVLAWSPLIGTLAFGDVAAGASSAIKSLQLLNQGPGGARLNVVNAIGSNSSDFSLTGTCIPDSVLPQDQSCRIDVRFVPGSAGAKQATIQVASTGTLPPGVQLTGNGLGGPSPELAVSATQLTFAATRAGAQSLPSELTLASKGSGILQITALSVDGPYTVQNGTCPTVPFSLPAGGECTVVVTFVPQGQGAVAGTLRVTTTADPTPHEVPLSGQGEPAPDLSSGGCSIAAGDSMLDPTLGSLALLAIAALCFRQRVRTAARRGEQPAQHRP